MRLPLGLKHFHILLPKGFIQGQKLQETLRQLTLPFSNSTNFDRLPTPFRAVATDLETGKAVVLDKGDLSIAMRASISAPGVFAPVDYQGRLLVDGGLAENLPIDIARAMNAGHPHRVRRELPAADRASSSIRRCPSPIRCWRSWCARIRTGKRPVWRRKIF